MQDLRSFFPKNFNDIEVIKYLVPKGLLKNNAEFALFISGISKGNPTTIGDDATEKEAYDSDIHTHAKIMSTGCCAPGAILDDCSPEFLAVFNGADIVISKGQGNYEALSGCSRPVFFLLKAKCHMVAGRFGTGINEYVFKYQTELI